jgi:cytochrome c oxidase assembly protein subunit 15
MDIVLSKQPFSRFLHLTKLTLLFVYLVIVAGSIVRATGSGMGCPDWPRCFGHWIPPTNVDQLPPDYQIRYKVQNQPIAGFNALKTWTEYGNRLIGAILGLLMFAQLLFAWKIRKENNLFLRLALLTLILTGMEGVLGAFVVHTNLKTGVITMHMFLSLLILAIQALMVNRGYTEKTEKPSSPLLSKLIIASLILTTCQILLGTQVREHVDVLLQNFDENSRGDILNNVGALFLSHGFFAWALLAVNLFVAFKIFSDKPFFISVKKLVISLLLLLLLEIGAGASLSLFALPAYIQPVHLLLASLLFGVQWGLVLKAFPKKQLN